MSNEQAKAEKHRLKILILQGLPASGKSTWAREHVATHEGWQRINKDDLREMLHNGKWSGKNEKAVLRIRDASIRAALESGQNVIVDDTNFNPVHVDTITEIAKDYAAQVEVKFFDVSLYECLIRNSLRPNKVPDKVIQDMYEKYVLPQKPKLQQDESLPKAICVDLDGTVALHKNRDPFDYNRCYDDEPNTPVVNCVKAMEAMGYKIVFVSAREDFCRELSERWLLEKCNFKEGFELHMRKTGDFRKDSIVKDEIYKGRIMPRYYVEFILDDRKQVVDRLREMGFTVLQVAPGNF